MKRLTDLRWLAALLAVLVLVGAASVAHGGGRWTGVDPELLVDGHMVNVVVAVPPGGWCKLDGPIEFTILVPDLETTFFIAESTGEMVPGNSYTSDPDHTRCGVYTTTTLGEHDGSIYGLLVSGLARSGSKQFPVDITISVNGEERVTCSGMANRLITCDPVLLQ